MDPTQKTSRTAVGALALTLALAGLAALVACPPHPTAPPVPPADPIPDAAPFAVAPADAGPRAHPALPVTIDAGRRDLALGEACFDGAECNSGVCEGKGCGATQPGRCVSRDRTCSMITSVFCGCDGESFSAPSDCPGQPYAATGPCPGHAAQ